jgi:hypothetical protein
VLVITSKIGAVRDILLSLERNLNVNYKKEEPECELLSRLRKEFGKTWFTATMAKTRLAVLQELSLRNILEASKSRPSGSVNFKVKDYD